MAEDPEEEVSAAASWAESSCHLGSRDEPGGIDAAGEVNHSEVGAAGDTVLAWESLSIRSVKLMVRERKSTYWSREAFVQT